MGRRMIDTESGKPKLRKRRQVRALALVLLVIVIVIAVAVERGMYHVGHHAGTEVLLERLYPLE
jgi:hypothetical protein